MKPIFEAAVRFGTWTKNFLNHLFYLLYGKPLGNSTHIVPTCNIARIFACFLSSCLISTYSKVILWLPKIWALGIWNAKIDWNPCLPITLDCSNLKKWKSILTVWSCSEGAKHKYIVVLRFFSVQTSKSNFGAVTSKD